MGRFLWPARLYDDPATAARRSNDAAVLFFFAERLPRGAGYHVHIEPMSEAYSSDKHIAARQTNAMVERLIAMAPSQYLWGYNRYKSPLAHSMRQVNHHNSQ